MNGVSGFGAAQIAQTQADSPSRRPGTANHPGRHLGQIKHAPARSETDAALPLVQQQISTVNAGDGQATQKSGKGQGGAGALKEAKAANDQLSAQTAQTILDETRRSNDNINDSLQFMGRFNAISTAFSTP